MPTDSPHLSKQLRPLAVAMSPVLWSRFKPDRFDSFSCGMLLFAMLEFRIPSAQFHERDQQHFLPYMFKLYLYYTFLLFPSLECQMYVLAIAMWMRAKCFKG